MRLYVFRVDLVWDLNVCAFVSPQVYYPELLVWVSQEPFAYKEMEGGLIKVRASLSCHL